MVSGFTRFAILAAIIGLTTACGGSPEPTPEATSSPEAEGGDATSTDETAAPPVADFGAPLVPGKEDDKPEALPNVVRLIPPTNPDARAQDIEDDLRKQNVGNRDPFSIPITISPSVSTTPEGAAGNRTAARGRGGPQPIPIPSQAPPILTSPPTRSAPRGASSPRSTTAQPAKPATTPPKVASEPKKPEAAAEATPATPPAPPTPSLALGVKVTGVVQVGTDYKIVVEVPGERTARYVSVGDRLSDGSVLVKRVELDELLDPIVVFEQFGQEVLKPVGEAPPSQVAVAPNL